MRFFLLGIILTGLTGCGAVERASTSWTGKLTYKCSKVGTMYVQSDSGLAPLYDKQGRVVPCHSKSW